MRLNRHGGSYGASRPLLYRLLALGGIFAVAMLMTGIGPALADDNGGSIKVDDTAIETIPENVPHLSCTFRVEFRGFDADDVTGFVTFELVAPTGSGVLLSDQFPLTSSGTGGNDLSGSKTYTLTFPSNVQPTKQGFHVRLTANGEENAPGKSKTKVFWVEPCQPPTQIPVGTLGTLGLAALLGAAAVVGQSRSRALPRGMQANSRAV
jgi:hypothetical protein